MYASQIPNIGYKQIELTLASPDATSRYTPSGETLFAADNYWGSGQFIYCQAGNTITQFGLVQILPTYDSTNKKWQYAATHVPNTANLGTSAGVALAAATTGQYIWVQVAGLVPVWCNASIAANTGFGIVAAGQGGAVAAGKSVLAARIVGPATTTVVKNNCQSASGSYQLLVPNSDGWFTGMALSGTGIGASALVSSISPDGRLVTMSVVTTAAVAGSVTGTYNDGTNYFNLAYLNDPMFQGPIT